MPKANFRKTIRVILALFSACAFIMVVVFAIPVISRPFKARTFLKTKPTGRIVYAYKGDIWMRDFTEESSEVIISGPNCEYPRFSPNGKLILFKHTDGRMKHELWIARHDGTEKRRLCFLNYGAICFWRDDTEIIALGGLFSESYRIIKIVPKIKVLDWQPVETKGGWAKNPSQAVSKISSIGDNYPFIYCSSDGKYYIKGIHPSLLLAPNGTRFILSHPFGYHINNIDRKKMVLKIRDVASKTDLLGLVSGEIDGIGMNGGYPRWSPDSQKVVFDASRGEDYSSLIWICEFDNSDKVTLKYLSTLRSHKRNLKGCFLERYSMPCWSPDGRYVACSHMVPSFADKIQPIHMSWHGKSWIYIHDLETGSGVDLFEGSMPNWHM